ncbi:MAG: bifunctional lysine ketoglutarate reductase /saccharopine dehydrogenase family protein [Phycisphaerales bacterium]|nr:bifunctional lysine ketoglutarate reductase /saccharopine dehydrogenase family protein [Phycisphaerales bacterium]
MNRIGIRREDKSKWEARAPLVPTDVELLIREHEIEFLVQPSPIRAFPDADYQKAGALSTEDLSDCDIIMGVKEIPLEKFEPNKTYVIFSHTIKGQSTNMPALRRLAELRCQLIDYEMIADEHDRRLVAFGHFAGIAGMVDSLWALGRRLEHEGIDCAFSRIQPAHQYNDLEHARRELAKVASDIRRQGLPEAICPFVCGFAGYGQVSQGAQEIYDLLPGEEIMPEDLAATGSARNVCYKVVFHEEHMVERCDVASPFELQEYYTHPERYRACFAPFVEHLTILINGIYWDPKYPRMVTRSHLRDLYSGQSSPRLRVIGDITCDIDGSLACTVRATTPDNPVYVFDPGTGRTHDGVDGHGPVVLAVDALPCEVPVDASRQFSLSLSPFLPGLAGADFTADLLNSGLPPELQRATIVYDGELTERFSYLRQHIS